MCRQRTRVRRANTIVAAPSAKLLVVPSVSGTPRWSEISCASCGLAVPAISRIVSLLTIAVCVYVAPVASSFTTIL